MYLIDTHCHLHDREFFSEEQAEKMLERARARGVKQIICIGTNEEDSEKAYSFAKERDNVFCSWGIHPEYASGKIASSCRLSGAYERPAPWDAARTKSDGQERATRDDGLARLGSTNGLSTASEHKLVCIGEIGLDYHYPGYNREDQIKLLEESIDLAIRLSLPCSFHVRDALPDFFAVVKNFSELKPSVLHSFSDTKESLEYALSHGFYIGINGLITFANLACFRDLTPDFLDHCILETDAPFLTPEPNRGKINEPGNIADIATWLSSKLGVSASEIAEKTTNNARKIFHLPDPESAEPGARAEFS